MWNWSKSALCDDALFITSCINHALLEEIQWPALEKRIRLRTNLPKLQGCIGFINGSLIKIRKPWQNKAHHTWFNGRKKIYVMNNVVILDYRGLFIYIDGGYPSSFHDVSILRHLNVYKDWRTSPIEMSTLNIYWEMWAIWVKRCSLCI
jgi:hypothetical protein